jgi:hypothetical protein
MLSSLDLYLFLCSLIGTFIVMTVVLRAGQDRSDCTIARVLYDAEHSEKIR